ncbi:tRNA (guanosine(37)-N1)-methyltransferase TrmD [Candidatus Saccharibacteria bacterium RIFCSPHIGHO2_12_FULL_49_19]|nr:MAG: tRNA (guanosine(37)-N1)-methyltransferase TrmD [Candidatus Saccharibacteria bacterium RIFCSPHIGHO2_01_FULL_49_21]OGL36429.1 MAG: tRNA (guanosine(37)-N1)-methyltransferase TrmD [Candidatus Saccharibacteria bacterium RIFCSPHIGHO2_12_FULL_49_19]OGL37943.1 MAG: tRNA (guanosine(37)-N1)-methyltransferase TrmD [Candidatus Saccharibacteria bacterium RIFCSPLOWO2_01_FULL_49_22]
MTIQIITLFPEMFEGVLNTSMLRKAQEKKLVDYGLINLRDYGIGPRKQVDDTPYGGGDGMVLRPEPLVVAIEDARSKVSNQESEVILLTPRGAVFTQADARELAKCSSLILVCGRYEGYDERVAKFVNRQVSIGDYVLTGGELPAMVVADAVTRLIPGVLGGETSAELESFSDGVAKEHPHYTRPEQFRDLKVPEVLISGNHEAIADWRKKHSV